MVERPICILFFFIRRCGGVVNAIDSKSIPFGGAGSSPANVSRSRSSVGRSSASHAEGPGFDPQRELSSIVWTYCIMVVHGPPEAEARVRFSVGSLEER